MLIGGLYFVRLSAGGRLSEPPSSSMRRLNILMLGRLPHSHASDGCREADPGPPAGRLT